MRVLIVGPGGREHALALALAASPLAPELHCAPGNPGMAELAALHPDVGTEDVPALVALARRIAADLVVVGPEAPLVAGLADELAAAGIATYGPSAAAARLEGSKAWAKEVMAAAGVPTAAATVVSTVADGLAAIGGRYPVALKFDGLAAGKGVVLPASEEEAEEALEAFLEERRFGAGDVVVEEFLHGEELSLLAVCDGVRAVPLAPARDYKRIGDGDAGPNTGGMGAFSPVADAGDADALCAQVHQPVLDELARRGTPFVGTLYAGLMLTAEGPRVIEYNARFGDPETQAVLPRMTSDLLGLLAAAAGVGGGSLADVAPPAFDDGAAVCVVLASAGYPRSSSSGDVITGVEDAEALPGVHVVQAGTALDDDGALVTAGGRVLGVVGRGPDVPAARAAAYAGADRIAFDGLQRRSDIAGA